MCSLELCLEPHVEISRLVLGLDSLAPVAIAAALIFGEPIVQQIENFAFG